MADEDTQQEQETPDKKEPPRKRGILLPVSAAIVALAAAGGGVFLARTMMIQTAQGESPAPVAPPAPVETALTDFAYYEIDPITVNLDEPRMARYIRMAVTLAFKNDDFNQASKVLEQRKPELKSMLTEHLVGCTIEDVRGKQNFNRLRREIQDRFNERFWPDKPLIHHVIFKEFAVQ